MRRHLFVDISAHGFGHLAQVAPVINALLDRRLPLQLTIRSALPFAKLASRIHTPFDHISTCSDFGFAMIDATTIDHATSRQRYRDFHDDWADKVTAEAAFLRAHHVDLVLTDVAYLPLAGAAQAGIPAMSMCSLNWADLFCHYYGHETGARKIHHEILAAYRQAKPFFRPTPSMAMAELADTCAVAPIGACGKFIGDQLRAQLGCGATDKIILIAFGGIDHTLDVAHWPMTPGLYWLVPAAWETERADMAALEALDLNFTDLLASVDAVVTKPGYGTFVEAACNGTPVLYQRRDNWPEQDCLIEWLQLNARALEASPEDIRSGTLLPALTALWQQAAPPRPNTTGSEEIADYLARCLTADSRIS